MRRFVWIAVAAAMMVPGPAIVAAAPSAGTAQPASFADADGLRVLGATWTDNRDVDVRVLSKQNIGRPLDVRILLPEHYTDEPQRRYPVLYLFHGTSGVASDWVKAGHAEQTTAPYPLITVMP